MPLAPSPRSSNTEIQLPKKAGLATTPLCFDEDLVLHYNTTKVHEEAEQAIGLCLLSSRETTLLTSCQGPTFKSFQHDMGVRDIQIITRPLELKDNASLGALPTEWKVVTGLKI